MATIPQKIQDTAHRIGRLGRYLDRAVDAPPTVVKSRGCLYLIPVNGRVLACDPRISQAWYWWGDGDYLDQELTLQGLLVFEERLIELAMERARHEAVEELARRKVRRVTRPETRGFKADMKKRDAKAKSK